MKINVAVKGDKIVGFMGAEPFIANGIKVQVGLNAKPGQRIHELEVSDDIMKQPHDQVLKQIQSHLRSKVK